MVLRAAPAFCVLLLGLAGSPAVAQFLPLPPFPQILPPPFRPPPPAVEVEDDPAYDPPPGYRQAPPPGTYTAPRGYEPVPPPPGAYGGRGGYPRDVETNA